VRRVRGARLLSADELLRISAAQAPGSHVVKLMLPKAKNRIAEVHREWSDGERFGNRANVFIDAESGALVAVNSSRLDRGAQSAWRWIRPLHEGLWGGSVSRFFYGLVGLAPAALLFTGLTAFYYRKRARKKLIAKRATVVVEERESTPVG
jgi:uncharacterized iron-regulated membrane protein